MKFKDTKYGDLTGQTYDGNIEIRSAGLTSLEGAPKIVKGTFNCSHNKLVSLEFSPSVVDGEFVCAYNSISSLKGMPKKVLAFNVTGNHLMSLEFAPSKFEKYSYCSSNDNPHLTEEMKLRRENPKMSESKISSEMYKLTKYPFYLPAALKKVFLIKDKK